MKRGKYLVIPLVFVAGYIGWAMVIQQFVADSILATLLTNALLIVIGFFYYNSAIGDACLPVSPVAVPITALFLIPFWFCLSLTATFLVSAGLDLAGYATMEPNQATLYALMSIFVAPLAEEILFRGIIFRSLKRIWSLPVVYAVTSIVFGLFHGTIPHLYIGIMCGLLFSVVYEYTGRISSCIMLHAGYNLMSVILAGLAVPDFLGSPTFLMLANVVIFIILVVACALVARSMPARVGKFNEAKVPKQTVAKFLRRVVPGYAGPVDLTVGLICKCFLPTVQVMVLDAAGVQLYIGTVTEIEQPQNAAVIVRKLCANSSWTYTEQSPGNAQSRLVLKVL